SRMISAISWIPKGVAKSVPSAVDPPTNEEIEKILKNGFMQIGEENENGSDDEILDTDECHEDDELRRALSVADALGKASGSSKSESDFLTDALKELDMDNYDEEDDGVEIFGSGISNLYYPSNVMDPYLKDQNVDDSEEEEDVIIKADDSVIVCARNEDDVSHMEVWIMEDTGDGNWNMYVHHDIIIPAFPLCMAWLDCPIKGGERGNFIAVGSMLPAIEIWDLDIIDQVVPSVSLGGVLKKKKKDKKLKLKYVKYKEGSHRDAVLGLAWNKEYRNILASASADKLVKIWDVATENCKMTLENHTDKVQAVAWNHFAPEVLLSGSFDHTVVMRDGKSPSHDGFKWSVASDVESLAWDPHSEHSFVVSLENGTVAGFDIRTATSDSFSESKPVFTLHAHEKAVSTVAYHSSFPNLLATGSMDKTVKLWDLSNQPTCVGSRKAKAGAVFSISFSVDNPFVLAMGGSNGKLQVWNLVDDDEISRRYGKYT
ncbi:hypothetical protein M569_12697, partial [Genlisea aurea]